MILHRCTGCCKYGAIVKLGRKDRYGLNFNVATRYLLLRIFMKIPIFVNTRIYLRITALF